jgi:hypothetical protein
VAIPTAMSPSTKLLEATPQAHLEALQHHEQAVRDLEELRTAGMNAMGLDLTRRGDDGDK